MLYAQRAKLSRQGTSPRLRREWPAALVGIAVGAVLGGLAAGAGIHLALRAGATLAPLVPAPRASDLDRVRTKMAVEPAEVNAKLARAEAELLRLQQDIARVRNEHANEARRGSDDETPRDGTTPDDAGPLRDALAASEQRGRALAREVRAREAEVERLRMA